MSIENSLKATSEKMPVHLMTGQFKTLKISLSQLYSNWDWLLNVRELTLNTKRSVQSVILFPRSEGLIKTKQNKKQMCIGVNLSREGNTSQSVRRNQM